MPNLILFLDNPGFASLLKKSWDGEGYYVDPQTCEAAVSGIQQHLLVYHVYRALMGGGAEHVGRASALARRLADAVRPDGYLDEPNGVIGDHPAAACSVADALGPFCYYGTKLGVGAELIAAGSQAIERIVRQHPAVRIPSGRLLKALPVSASLQRKCRRSYRSRRCLLLRNMR
jgi:hypothetical protein